MTLFPMDLGPGYRHTIETQQTAIADIEAMVDPVSGKAFP
jgi:hypothetical protein